MKFQDDGLETKSSLGLDNCKRVWFIYMVGSESESESVLSIVPEVVMLLVGL